MLSLVSVFTMFHTSSITQYLPPALRRCMFQHNYASTWMPIQDFHPILPIKPSAIKFAISIIMFWMTPYSMNIAWTFMTESSILTTKVHPKYGNRRVVWNANPQIAFLSADALIPSSLLTRLSPHTPIVWPIVSICSRFRCVFPVHNGHVKWVCISMLFQASISSR